MQKTFSGVDTEFSWVKQDDGSFWYSWNPDEAKRTARRQRAAEAKRLRAEGYTVTMFSLGSQQLTRGGIGTPYPEITIFATVYGFNAYR